MDLQQRMVQWINEIENEIKIHKQHNDSEVKYRNEYQKMGKNPKSFDLS